MAATPPTRRALFVGIDYEGSSSQLRGCSQDVMTTRQLLKYTPQNSVTLADDPRVPDIVDEPTNCRIIAYMKDLADSKADRIFFHYSGHGSYTTDYQADENDKRDELIVTSDFVRMSDDVINDLLFNRLAPTSKCLALFDSCFSGTVADLRFRMGAFGYDLSENATDTTVADAIVISGCTDKQTSADAFIDGKAQGAMTAAFKAAFEATNGGKVTPRAFVLKMRDWLAERKYPQIPQLSYSRKNADQTGTVADYLAVPPS